MPSPALRPGISIYGAGLTSRGFCRLRAPIWEGWAFSPSLGEMSGDGGIIQPYGLYYRYYLLDIGDIPYNALSSEPVLWAGLAALRGAFRPEEGAANLAAILQNLRGGGAAESQVLTYIAERWNIRPRELRAAQTETKPERGEANMGLLAEGLKAEGVVEVLKRQLQRRFGPLSEATQSRLDEASREELDAWVERILEAPSLEAVFGGAPR